jgi:O-antigen/teichoic acid export membrane protein
VLVGLHRNEYAALGIGGSRLGGAVLAVIAARYTNSLVVLAVCIAGMNIWGGLLQVFFVRRAVPWLRVNAAGVCRATAHELGKFCASLSVWSFSMFLVAGLDVSVVGYFDFSAVGYYSVASSLVMFFAGANGAVCSALMTPVAALHASGQSERIRRLLLSTSRLNTFVNFVAAAGMLAFGRLVLRLWVGETYAAQSLAYLDILVIANAVRLVANPYASMLVATGQQRQGIAQGLVEGITNFVVSIAAAALLGPIGVALGTLVGALCGVGWSYSFTVKRTTEIPLSRKQFAIEGLVRPLSCALPIVLCAASVHYLGVSVRTLILLSAGTALTGLLAYRFGEMPSMAQIARRRLAPTV